MYPCSKEPHGMAPHRIRTPARGALVALAAAGAFLLVPAAPLAAQAHDHHGAHASSVNVAGSWAFSVVTENGTGTPRIVLEQNGSELGGTYSSARMGTRRLRGAITGDTIRFSIAPGPEGGDVTMMFIGTLSGPDAMVGVVDYGAGMGGATFSARKESPDGI
jgi:hypothetical protein